MCGCNGGDGMVLGGLYRWLGSVDSVAAGLHNLDGNTMGCNELLDDAGAFVVKDVDGFILFLLFEFGVYALECGNHARVFS